MTLRQCIEIICLAKIFFLENFAAKNCILQYYNFNFVWHARPFKILFNLIRQCEQSSEKSFQKIPVFFVIKKHSGRFLTPEIRMQVDAYWYPGSGSELQGTVPVRGSTSLLVSPSNQAPVSWSLAST